MLLLRIGVPTPFPVGPVNAYLLGPDPLVLVDCGPATGAAWEALGAGLAEAGFAVGDLECLVLTHPHQDHAGLARRVRDASGCRVLAHPSDHARLLGRPGEWEGIVRFLLEVTRRAGAPEPVMGSLEEGYQDLARYAEPLDEIGPLGEGSDLEAGGARLRALHTPGHARGALCLWEPEGRVLLSGDTLLPGISSNAIQEPGRGRFRERTLPQYLGSLRRLAALGPRSVLPGHGDPMGGPGALVRRRLAAHERRAARLREWVEAGVERPWELALRLFPDLGTSSAFLAVSEVVGHLDLLADRGAIAFEGQDGPWVARPLPPARG